MTRPYGPSVKPRLLDLFCGAGGAARGYELAGFEVVGVDLEPQPNYPYEFIKADALGPYVLEDEAFLLEFDAVHASPPCQGYSTKTRDQSKHPRLIEPVRARLLDAGVPFVIENVDGAKWALRNPIRLCGSTFGLDVRRHRWFEASFPLVGAPCNHRWQTPRFELYDHGRWYKSAVVHVFGEGGGKGKEHWPQAMGVDWMTDAELVESIPPAFTQFIGVQLHAFLRAREAA